MKTKENQSEQVQENPVQDGIQSGNSVDTQSDSVTDSENAPEVGGFDHEEDDVFKACGVDVDELQVIYDNFVDFLNEEHPKFSEIVSKIEGVFTVRQIAVLLAQKIVEEAVKIRTKPSAGDLEGLLEMITGRGK